MKKLLIGALTLALALSASATALAADPQTEKRDVWVEYRQGAVSPDKVAVDIVWEEMLFHYTEGAKVWDPASHEVQQEDGVWADDSKTICLTNHSNVTVQAAFTFTGESVTGTFEPQNLTLLNAKGTTTEEPPTGETYFSVTDGAVTAAGKVGTITVTVAAKQ